MKKAYGQFILVPALEYGSTASFKLRVFAKLPTGVTTKVDAPLQALPSLLASPTKLLLHGRWTTDMIQGDFTSHPLLHAKLQQSTVFKIALSSQVLSEKICAVLRSRDPDVKKALYYSVASPFEYNCAYKIISNICSNAHVFVGSR